MNYGRSLADMSRVANRSGVTSGEAYTPGRRDRSVRIMGENIASRKADSIRQAKQNAYQFAVSSLPTYLLGTPATPNASPEVGMTAAGANKPDISSFLGGSLSNLFSMIGSPYIQAGAYGPIIERLMRTQNNPLMNANYDNPLFRGDSVSPLARTGAPGWT